MKNLNINELENVQESAKINSFIKEVINFLLEAINDWPNEVVSLEDYELDVNAFIEGEVTTEKINATLKWIDLSNDAWKAESLTQLINVFALYDNDISLKEIIGELKMRVNPDL